MATGFALLLGSKAVANVKGSRPKPAAARTEPPAANARGSEPPKVLSQTSRRHKVQAAIDGEDEFSVFSTSPTARKKDPAELNPQPKQVEKEGGGRLIRFFKGFFDA